MVFRRRAQPWLETMVFCRRAQPYAEGYARRAQPCPKGYARRAQLCPKGYARRAQLCPKVLIPSGARKGRTGSEFTSSERHLTVVCGHTARGQGAAAGQTVGGGHFTSGQRGRGHGGQSPHLAFRSSLVSMMIGCCFGIELFITYCDRSGTGGHSDFSM